MESRRLEILRAIVDEYVATQEPVGSKSIADRHALGISPATIRNEMALLEEAGLITHPHTSAGRIPTDLGYRVFVDKLAAVKPLSTPERRAIESFLEGAHDLDDVVMRTVKLLADVTKQVAVVQYPSLVRSRVRHLELLLLTPSRLMVILVTDAGRVEQRVLEFAADLDENFVSTLRSQLNQEVLGQRLLDCSHILSGVVALHTTADQDVVTAVISTLTEMTFEKPEERVVLAGTANLARFREDFSEHIHPILEALEEQVVLLRLLGDVGETVQVRIGQEQSEENLRQTSLVTVGYGSHSSPLGALGVIGPTRMDYAGSMAAVAAVARYVGRYMNEGS
ncbi:MAG: heat-inducible transcriptional repressor HrcA [Actinobacteria bacterium]|nr:heat-inducible transcriptional repressor HrcA [Actinomycetota bacterium]